SHTEVAARHNINRATLSQKRRGVTASRAAMAIGHQKLSPQQVQEPVQRIKGLTERDFPPTRGMIRSFASAIAKEPVSESWVTRFISRHNIYVL
ncbi:hypothetical protein BS50DRAFT_471869, partial [Corynespora cassiicola Philippines]